MEFKIREKDEESKEEITVSVHRYVLASKSSYFNNLFKENSSNSIDLTVNYSAFKKIIDYIYLDNLHVLDEVRDS